MRNRPTRLFPPAYFLLATALIVLVDRLAPEPAWPPPGLRWIAWIPAGVGLLLFVTTVVAFKRTHTPLRPFKDRGQLMTHGTFRVSRNPIYLGMTLLLFAFCLRLQSPPALPLPLLFAGWIQYRFVLAEEEFLGEEFGDAYREYQSRVRRWL